MSLTDRTKPTDVSLNTDLYELTMAQGFWESGLVDTQATFNAFFRENPFGGGCLRHGADARPGRELCLR